MARNGSTGPSGPLVAVAAFLTVILGAAAVWLLTSWNRGGPTVEAAGPSVSSEPAADPDVTEDLAGIEAALNARDQAAIDAVLTREAAGAYDAEAVLPEGSSVDVLGDTFVRSGPETAYVTAEVTGPQPGRHVLLLWLQDDAWHLVATAPEP